MKVDSLRALQDQELEAKIGELREELFNFRFRHATGQLDNPMMLRVARRNLARALTIQQERRLGLRRGRREEPESMAAEAKEE
jgi:large subunit ribosomal protein L29